MPSSATPRSRRAAYGAAAMIPTLLVFAATANAMLSEPRPSGTPTAQAPTIVRETVVGPASGGPTTLAYALVAVGLIIALLAAGYLGARMATRTIRTHAG
jgi:hypothetical protein